MELEMTDEAGQQAQPDPREEKFVVETELLTKDQLDGLIDEYCTRYHGLNDTENPMGERDRVRVAVKRGDLVVWFDPVENTAGLSPPS
jgi:uncharacterized protein YheU (UPF0270 family)